MKYLITGGAGFIGSNIARELVRRGEKIKILDNLSTGSLKNLKGILDKVKFIKGDIRDFGLTKKEFKGVDFVLHQAAFRAVPRSIEDPVGVNSNNIEGTLKVLVAARDSGVKRVVYASSSSVYGDVGNKKNKETMTPNPKSPYALSKLAGEYYCRIFSEIWGLETVSLRYFNVFGPYQNPNSKYAAVIPLFINAIARNKQPIVFGDGNQSRDFCPVANVVSANLLACKLKKAKGEVYNIANGENHSLNKLLAILNNFFSKNIKPIYQSPRSGDVYKSFADINLAKNNLGYKPIHDFKKGLEIAIQWFKNN